LVPAAAALCAALARRRQGHSAHFGARGAASSDPRRVGMAARGGGDELRALLLGQEVVASTAPVAAPTVPVAAPAGSLTRPRVVFVVGGPGSGKGTQCERIAKDFGYVHLSAGDLLRAERKVEGSPLGAVIEKAIIEGGTVPSEVIAGLLEQAMRAAGWAEVGFVVDGYPRSAEQLKGWEATLSTKVDFMFCLSLEVGEKEMNKRLLGRSQSSGRADDNEETIKKRFVTFGEETGPLLAYFESAGKLRKVNGEKEPDKVWKEVQKVFEAHEKEEAKADAKANKQAAKEKK